MKIKINIRQEIRVVVSLAIVSALVAFADRNLKHNTCRDIIVRLDNVRENHFVDEADVLRMVEQTPGKIRAEQFSLIDYRGIEQNLEKHRNLKRADVYNDFKGNLVVQVALRRPVARLVQEQGPDAYLSEEGVVMPVSERYSSRVLAISGTFVNKALQIQDLNGDAFGAQLLELVRYIHEDEFWSAQIAEIQVLENGKLLLYPQVTSQVVKFGKPENIDEKFLKLRVFYKKILPARGWTRYESVNLEYEGQVVAK